MAKKRVVKTAAGTDAPAEFSGAVVQEALQVTWTLNGQLKNTQIAYIRVGVLLARVRDEKLYAALKHPDMESYARERLHLGRSSLYNYLRVHDWICQCHQEWLEPSPKGFIPNLAEAADLIWIEAELTRTDLDGKKRAALEELRTLALAGKLEDGGLDKWRKQGRPPAVASLKSFLSALRGLRKRGAKLTELPAEVIPHLDAAIDILGHAQDLRVAGLDFGENGPEIFWDQNVLV